MTRSCNHDHHDKQIAQNSKPKFKTMTPVEPAHFFVKNKIITVPNEPTCSEKRLRKVCVHQSGSCKWIVRLKKI